MTNHNFTPQDMSTESLEKVLANVPNCFREMQGRLISYQPEKGLTIAFPVVENQLNPAGSMQGGFITAAFDNVFGPLCLITTGSPRTTTIDINTSYHRPIYPNDELIVTASVKSRGRTKIHMMAEAYNKENKLIATASTNYIHLD